MEILVSGLAEHAGLESARNVIGTDRPLQWIGPELLERSDEELLQFLAGRDLVWTYGLPWRDASATGVCPEVFDQWLSASRRVLNLRRKLGRRLVFVANERGDQRGAYDAALYKLVAMIIPEMDEVLSMLEASAQSCGQAAMPSRQYDESELLAELSRVLATERSLREERTGRLQYEQRLAELSSRNEQLQAAESACRRDAGALATELRETQVSLEQHFLEMQKIRAGLAKEKADRAAIEASNLDLRKSLDAAQAALTRERAALAKERVRSNQALADREALAVERGMRISLEKERALLLQRIEGMSAALARLQARTEVLESSAKAVASSWVPGRVRGVAKRMRRGGARNTESEVRRIAQSGWFDAGWYLETYPDVRAAGAEPAEHYAVHGWKEGRDPGPGFDTLFYLDQNQDVKASGMNPLWHFLEFGQQEGRSPKASQQADEVAR